MKSNKYEEQAQKFLQDTKTTCRIVFVEKTYNADWGEGETDLRNKYKVTLSNSEGKMSFVFWDSLFNTKKNIRPTKYDVLACLEKWDPGTYQDFCCGYGYDAESRESEKIYKEVVEQYTNLVQMFSDEEMEALREIQ